MTSYFRPFVAALLLLAFGVTVAQAPKGGTVTQAAVALLDDPAVRKELKLSASQDKSVQAEFKKANGEIQEIVKSRPSTPEAHKSAQTRIRAIQMSLVNRLDRSLSAAQRTRLKEIGLQFFGPFAMLSPEVAKELKITPAQTAKIKAAQKNLLDKTGKLQQARREQLMSIPRPKDQKDQKAIQAYVQKVNAEMAKFAPSDRKKIDAYKKQAESEVLTSLSKAQRTQWTAMLGAKFTPPKR